MGIAAVAVTDSGQGPALSVQTDDLRYVIWVQTLATHLDTSLTQKPQHRHLAHAVLLGQLDAGTPGLVVLDDLRSLNRAQAALEACHLRGDCRRV